MILCAARKVLFTAFTLVGLLDAAGVAAGPTEQTLITHYYQSILRRAPDAGGLAYWDGEITRMRDAGQDAKETFVAMGSQFIDSAEYRALRRLDAEFLTDLYQTFFQRSPDAGGLAYWQSQLMQGVPRGVVLAGFQFSAEFNTFIGAQLGAPAARPEGALVIDFYRGYLNRLPDANGLTFWLGQFRAAQCNGASALASTADAISSQFLNAAEYAGRARSNADFVGDMYSSFLRRGGDLTGVQFWQSQLDAGTTRDAERRQFLQSPEFQARLAAVAAAGCYAPPVAFTCQEGTADPRSNAPRVCHDLDGDGVIDSSVVFSNGQLIVRGARTRDIALGAPAGATLKTVTTIGNYSGGPLQELAVRVDDWSSANGNVAKLYILDLDDAVNPQIASLTQPFGTPTPVYVGFPRAADGRRIPVMVAGQEQSNVAWHYLCRFQPGFNDAGCGPGFAKWSAVPPGASEYRRHQGAWIQDTNGDGTEDLHLPFYSVHTSNQTDGGVLTISMANNQQTWTRLNMAEMAWDGEGLYGGALPPSWASMSGSAQGFDSGRLYGTVSSFTVDGRDKALMIGGNPVGYFPTSNSSSEAWLIMCNVTRYVGLLGNPQGQIGARALEWGWYLGFYQNVFAGSSGNGALLKTGYMAHGCIHRYDDSRVESSQGTPSVAFNVFRSMDVNSQPQCESEQRALFNGGFTAGLNDTFLACVIGNASKPGRWIVQFLDESSGNGRIGLSDAYMWGYSNQLLPGGKFVYLIEVLGAAVPFNRTGVPSTALKVHTLESSPSWQVQQVGTLPVVGLPALRIDDYASYPLVAGQQRNGNFAHLVTRPNQAVPGLVDIQMNNGQWVGYSTVAATLVAK